MLSAFTQLFRNWWLFALRGVLAIVFGALALLWPGQTKLVLVLLFGTFVLVDGIFALISGIAFRAYFVRWWAIALEGLAGMVIGLSTFIWPDVTGLALLYFIAAWAIITGIFEILVAIHFQDVIAGEWAMIFNGLLSAFFGCLLLAFPAVGVVGLVWLIGIYAITAGVMGLILALHLRSLLQQFKTVVSITV